MQTKFLQILLIGTCVFGSYSHAAPGSAVDIDARGNLVAGNLVVVDANGNLAPPLAAGIAAVMILSVTDAWDGLGGPLVEAVERDAGAVEGDAGAGA